MPAEAGAPKRVAGAGYSPSNPNGLMSPNFALMGAQNVGMMGLGPSLYQGPDLYDPNSPWGPEPYPEQSSGPGEVLPAAQLVAVQVRALADVVREPA